MDEIGSIDELEQVNDQPNPELDEVWDAAIHEAYGPGGYADAPTHPSETAELFERSPSRDDVGGDYNPLAAIDQVLDYAVTKAEGAENEPLRAAWAGQADTALRTRDSVLRGELSAGEGELYLSGLLIPEKEIDALGQKYQALEREYDHVVKEMVTGERSEEVGDVDLRSIKYHQKRLETLGEMMAEGLTWQRLSDVSDDWNHLVEDEGNSDTRDLRKAFRTLNPREQREFLSDGVYSAKMSQETANWIWNQWT